MATKVEHSPERVRPSQENGRLIMSEHYGRYLWAAQLANEMNVLDAGCGAGYGAKILADAGASRVVGVDISETAVSEATKTYRDERIELCRGDLRALPFPEEEFDLVVCFEVIEHIDDRGVMLDELRRVLKLDGVLCISTPNSRVYPPGNPHHVYEYEPEEFTKALSKRFSQVALYRQGAWLTSAVLSDGEFASRGVSEAFSGRAIKLDDKRPGEEIFTVAIAVTQELPSIAPTLVLGEPFEVRWWQEQIETTRLRADASVNEVRRQLHQANQAALEADAQSVNSAKRLLEVEELLSGLNSRIYALEEEITLRGDRIDALTQKLERADHVIVGMKNSISWRVTRPLRALKGSR